MGVAKILGLKNNPSLYRAPKFDFSKILEKMFFRNCIKIKGVDH